MGKEEVAKIISRYSDSFEDALCEHWNIINENTCPKGMNCTECLETIIKTLSKRFE